MRGRFQSPQAGHRATVGARIAACSKALASISTAAAKNCKSRISTTRNHSSRLATNCWTKCSWKTNSVIWFRPRSSLPTSRGSESQSCWSIARHASRRWSVFREARSPATRWTPPAQKRRLARLIAKALIAKPVFSKSDQPLFHGDPHAGNLFLTDDGCLGILDWSLAGTLGVRRADRDRADCACRDHARRRPHRVRCCSSWPTEQRLDDAGDPRRSPRPGSSVFAEGNSPD